MRLFHPLSKHHLINLHLIQPLQNFYYQLFLYVCLFYILQKISL